MPLPPLLKVVVCAAWWASAISLFAACPGIVSAQDVRTWTDITGQNKLQATYVSQSATKVTLKAADGRQYEIEILKLSPEDQAFLANMKTSNPFKLAPAGGDPFKRVEDTAPVREPVKNGAESRLKRPRAAAPPRDLKHGKRIDIKPPAKGWVYNVTPREKLAFTPQAVGLPKLEFAEHLEGFVVNRPGTHGILSTSIRGESCRLTLVDFRSGEIVASVNSKGEFKALGVDDDGMRVIVTPDRFNDGERGTLNIYRVEGDKLVQEARWSPFSDQAHGGHVEWAAFVGQAQLAAVSSQGRFSLWDLVTLREECYFDLGTTVVAAVSPDPNILAVTGQEEGVLFDVTRQSLLGAGAMLPKLAPTAIAFSPSGERLALVGAQRVVIVNAADGKLISDQEISGLSGRSLDFVHENYVLVGGSNLIELENQVNLWTFSHSGFGKSATTGGYTYFMFDGSGQAGIVAAQLPNSKALAALDKVLNEPESFALRPKMTVKLDISKVPAEHQTTVRNLLTKALTANQVTIGDESPILVQARVDGPNPRKIAYSAYRFGNGTEVDVNELITVLQIQYEGKSIWGRSDSNVPYDVSIKEGQTLQQAVSAATANPSMSIFYGALPRFVPKPSGDSKNFGITLGSSTITLRGVE